MGTFTSLIHEKKFVIDQDVLLIKMSFICLKKKKTTKNPPRFTCDLTVGTTFSEARAGVEGSVAPFWSAVCWPPGALPAKSTFLQVVQASKVF